MSDQSGCHCVGMRMCGLRLSTVLCSEFFIVFMLLLVHNLTLGLFCKTMSKVHSKLYSNKIKNITKGGVSECSKGYFIYPSVCLLLLITLFYRFQLFVPLNFVLHALQI